MALEIATAVAAELEIRPEQVARTLELLDGGATVPFIARYRKEATGELDEIKIGAIQERSGYLRELEERRRTVLASIEEQGKLTPELRARIEAAATKAELEDLYLPFRPKRRTRATMARARGLEPLADLIWAQEKLAGTPEELAAPFVVPENEVPDAAAALAGARDIVAERASEAAEVRGELRQLTWSTGDLEARLIPGQEEAGANYRDYFEVNEPIARIPSHRVLAMLRGEREGHLRLRLAPDREAAVKVLRRRLVRGDGGTLAGQLVAAIEDSWERLLQPAMETEARTRLKLEADSGAIEVFVRNLRQILMAPPLGGKTVLALDPGYRTGCKVAVLDPQGSLLHHDVVYLHQPDQARLVLAALLQRFGVEAVAIGNGTASRETDALVRALVREHGLASLAVAMVSEAGASVYSASPLAREELPDQDVTVRGAVSIGRRLQDPLAELVKIDPKSLGVGQYQHDVNQTRLREALDRVVVLCVHAVGVDLNTASPRLLGYVSGIGPALAQAIVQHRALLGGFRSRAELHDVPRLGPKAFEQAAGFLRVRGGSHPLDASAVHPERYRLVERMASDLGVSLTELMASPDVQTRIDPARYIGGDVGEPTMRDILAELARPGRDPRRDFETVEFNPEVTEVEHLREGMELAGVVTNLTRFGAFVDVGVHQDGLVHVSEISHTFVDDPAAQLSVGQAVKVKVLAVDVVRHRISLSIKACLPAPPPRPRPAPEPRPRPRPAPQTRPEKRPETRPDARPRPAPDRRPAGPPPDRRPAERRPPGGPPPDRRPERTDRDRPARDRPGARPGPPGPRPAPSGPRPPARDSRPRHMPFSDLASQLEKLSRKPPDEKQDRDKR